MCLNGKVVEVGSNSNFNLSPELDKYFMVFVDFPRAIGRNPDASGSRVPTYPALQ